MAATAALVSTAIIAGINVLMALITAQQEVNAGKRDYTPEELAMVDQLNAKSESDWSAYVAAAKARLAGDQDSPPPPANPS